MRRLVVAAIATLLATLPLGAQATSSSPLTGSQAPSDRVSHLEHELELLRGKAENGRVPPADSFVFGPRTIASDSTVRGPVGVADGNLRVAGRVDGDVIVINGDVLVERSGAVTGNVLDVGGHVTNQGLVQGEIRRLDTSGRPPMTTWDAVKLVIGSFAILFMIGVGVLMFAEGNLDGVVMALEQSFTKSFWVGVLGQLLMLPTLLLLLVGLVLTILGILLVPFAIVTYFIAAAGLVTLGFLAASRVIGAGWSRRVASPRAMSLRGLLLGIGAFTLLWIAAAAFTWHPIAGMVLRVVASIVTWVAATAGLGATLLSRAGTRRPGARPAARATVAGDLSWQTPTPVSGVAAARRPQSVSSRQTE
jgi:hypothetical protein